MATVSPWLRAHSRHDVKCYDIKCDVSSVYGQGQTAAFSFNHHIPVIGAAQSMHQLIHPVDANTVDAAHDIARLEAVVGGNAAGIERYDRHAFGRHVDLQFSRGGW